MKMESISNKQDIIGMQGLLNSIKVDKKKKYEDQFRGTAKIASIDKELQKLRDKLNNSESQSASEDQESVQSKEVSESQASNNSQTSSGDSKTQKTKSKRSLKSQGSMKDIVIPQEFKNLQRQISQIQPVNNNKSMYSLNVTQMQRNDPISGRMLKIELIDDIEELRQQLTEERINTDYLPSYDEYSDIETLKNIKYILMRKVRKQQSNSIVEDVLFMVLKGVESIFDGKTSIAGMSPNLKGLTKSVSLKMRNQKQQFSEAIESFCKKRGIGQNSKLFVQIAISAVKRNFLNKDLSQTEDRSEDLALLQQMYRNSN